MPLKDCTFIKISPDDILRPALPIRIINPHTNKSFFSYGIIDTGADECAIPAEVASILGHRLDAGKRKDISTGNGITAAYSHTTKFEVYHPNSLKLALIINNTPVDFLPNLHVILIGVKNFLSNYILKIDYPEKRFSIFS